ncbi:hypothetical protein GWI33_005455 [Rhynchophorus ferrugineus]|uniref:Uncharacterized protein n=1 Tax=Rhynchophorus ferrugineus TaxID=354439 RepID=A0A834IN74_RHYFE|nr:hypothetical protein GWI33_005455 [Rhynchophorus ferrugineus]
MVKDIVMCPFFHAFEEYSCLYCKLISFEASPGVTTKFYQTERIFFINGHEPPFVLFFEGADVGYQTVKSGKSTMGGKKLAVAPPPPVPGPAAAPHLQQAAEI